MSATLLFILWLCAANIMAFAAFAYDKRMARLGGWRVSENTLLMLALLGGSVGAVVAQQRLRHKTVKQPFRATLCLIIILQIAALALWLARPNLILSAFR